MTNHLQQETSAYLLQHADNPVAWHTWNEASLSLAKQQDKPILLSIGYSACHWCHVMAHESFADLATAELMNAHFINIKVDKEERPDLDKVYQTAHQLINQRPGGWPLTVILDPHTLLPFFAGTYFPKEPQFGLPAFTELLQQIIQFYQQEKQPLQEHQQQMRGTLARLSHDVPSAEQTLNALPLMQATQQLLQLYDKQNGGFGRQPKFPQPSHLHRLLKYSFFDLTQQKACLSALYTSLNKMAYGGIYDHLRGGFFRYSVDAQWRIPHFEKMLYDNAQLLAIYSDAYTISGNPLYLHHVIQTADWIRQAMQATEGAYYATLDADSEGEEGTFYLWDKQTIHDMLDDHEYTLFAQTFGLTYPANFAQRWHLYVAEPKDYPLTPHSALAAAQQKLLVVREQRSKPKRDTKIIVSWNGLMLKGMAKAARVTGDPSYIDSAVNAANFIRQHLWHNQKLSAIYQQGKARCNAYLDDYAYLLDGILCLLTVRWSTEHLVFAIDVAEALIKNFWDPTNKGFYFTAHDHEQLIYRPKPLTDEATPAGNGVAACALLRLGYLLSEPRYLTFVEQILIYALPSIQHLPYLHGTLLDALEDYLHPPKLVIIRGDTHTLSAWETALRQQVQLAEWVYSIPDTLTDLPAGLHYKKAAAHPVAYICQGTQCSEPITDIDHLINTMCNLDTIPAV